MVARCVLIAGIICQLASLPMLHCAIPVSDSGFVN